MDIPFTYVAQGNLVELRAYLANSDISMTDDRGNSFLHLAIKYNQIEIFDFLIENYADINLQNYDGETPLMLCVYYNRIGFLKALIKMKANYLLTNKLGETPFYKACFLGRGMIVSLFLENHMETLDCKNTNDEDIYFALLRSQNLTLFDFFAKKNDSFFKTTNYFNDTLLHLACKINSLPMVEYLLKYDVFVNAKNKAKETPIFYATKNGNREIFSLLVAKGAILDLVNSYDEGLYDVAEYQAFKDYIKEKEANNKEYVRLYPLHHAIILENIFEVENNLHKNNIEQTDKYGYTPIELATRLNNLQSKKILANYLKELKKDQL